jgi:hypothetical protein
MARSPVTCRNWPLVGTPAPRCGMCWTCAAGLPSTRSTTTRGPTSGAWTSGSAGGRRNAGASLGESPEGCTGSWPRCGRRRRTAIASCTAPRSPTCSDGCASERPASRWPGSCPSWSGRRWEPNTTPACCTMASAWPCMTAGCAPPPATWPGSASCCWAGEWSRTRRAAPAVSSRRCGCARAGPWTRTCGPPSPPRPLSRPSPAAGTATSSGSARVIMAMSCSA